MGTGRRIRTTLLQVTHRFISDWSFLESFRQQDKKYKSVTQKRNHDRYHKARPLPELPYDTPVWISTDKFQQSGRIVSASSKPVSTPTGQTRRNRSHVVPTPTQANSPETKQKILANESQQSPDGY